MEILNRLLSHNNQTTVLFFLPVNIIEQMVTHYITPILTSLRSPSVNVRVHSDISVLHSLCTLTPGAELLVPPGISKWTVHTF